MPFEHQMIEPANFDLQKVKEKTVRSYNYSTQLEFLKNGPEERGNPRNVYPLRDGSEGDVYEVLVKALASDPPFLTIGLDEVKERVAGIVQAGAKPNVQMALGYTPDLFRDSKPPLQWDSSKKQLTVIDPHFYFYLRYKGK